MYDFIIRITKDTRSTFQCKSEHNMPNITARDRAKILQKKAFLLMLNDKKLQFSAPLTGCTDHV